MPRTLSLISPRCLPRTRFYGRPSYCTSGRFRRKLPCRARPTNDQLCSKAAALSAWAHKYRTIAWKRWRAVIGGNIGLWRAIGGPGGTRTLTLNQLAGAWQFYEQMSASRKSHGLFERLKWGEAFASVVHVNVRFYRSPDTKPTFRLPP